MLHNKPAVFQKIGLFVCFPPNCTKIAALIRTGPRDGAGREMAAEGSARPPHHVTGGQDGRLPLVSRWEGAGGGQGPGPRLLRGPPGSAAP